MRSLLLFTSFFVSFLTSTAWGYPEMVRHSYTSCTTCHYSPDGGGLLTGYGRALSGELLSTWGSEKESRFAYVVDTPKNLAFGGHFRSVQSYVNNAAVEAARMVWMQADLEAGYLPTKQFLIAGTFGWDNTSHTFLSRRHFVRYQPDLKLPLYLRAGRFYPAYGIHFPDHVLWIRNRMDWGLPLKEPYTLEASYLGEEYQAIISGFLSRPDDPTTNSGVSASGHYILGKTTKVGASAAYTSRSNQSRVIFGPNATVGFAHDLFLLAEWGIQNVANNGAAGVWSTYAYGRLDYELIQGVHVYGVTELGKSNLNSANLSQGYGGGAQWFPRPHLEVRAEYQRQKGNTLWSDVAWVTGYFYL